MVAQTEATFGAVDILVNNAGIQFVANVEDFLPNAGTPSSRSTSPPCSTP